MNRDIVGLEIFGRDWNFQSGLKMSSQDCNFGNRPNTVSESTVSNTVLSEVFGPYRAPGRGLSEFQPIIRVPKRTHRVFRRTHRVCPETQ